MYFNDWLAQNKDKTCETRTVDSKQKRFLAGFDTTAWKIKDLPFDLVNEF